MSTIDPRVVRAQKQQQQKAGGGAYVLATVVAIVHAGLWALAGVGGVMILDTFRLMAVNQVGDGWDSAFDDDFPWLFLIGVFAGSWLGFVLIGRITAVLGGRAGLPFPFFTAFLGLAVGFAIFMRQWTKPEIVGFQKGFIEGEAQTPWDAGGWVMYALPWVLPLVFGILALLLLIVVVRGAVSGRRKVDGIRSMIQSGVRVVGAVSEVVSTGVEVMGNPYVQLTVQYKDAGGTERWVTKKHGFSPASLPRTGDVYTVWYDPSDPGNEKKIVLAPGDSDGTPA